MKKLICAMLLVSFVVLLCACSRDSTKKAGDLTIGFCYLGQQDDPYIAAHLNAFREAAEKAGISDARQIIKMTDAAEDGYKTVCTALDEGCDIVFAAGKALEDAMTQAATEREDVVFCMADGLQGSNPLENYHTFSFKEFETRYVSGLLAGEKLTEMILNGEITPDEALIGYIANRRDANSISAYTAFLIGARAACQTASLYVQYAYAENDTQAGNRAALALISHGCVLLSQQGVTSKEAAAACEENNVYYIGFINDASDVAPDCFVGAGVIQPARCYNYAIENYLSDSLPKSWSSGVNAPEDLLPAVNARSFSKETGCKKAQSRLSEACEALHNGSLRVFDTDLWTVDGKTITSTLDMVAYYGVEYINENGYFMENELSSLPKFEFLIDGVTELNPNETAFESIGGEAA